MHICTFTLHGACHNEWHGLTLSFPWDYSSSEKALRSSRQHHSPRTMHIFQIQVRWGEICSSFYVPAMYMSCISTGSYCLAQLVLSHWKSVTSNEGLHSHEAFEGETAHTSECGGVCVASWLQSVTVCSTCNLTQLEVQSLTFTMAT